MSKIPPLSGVAGTLPLPNTTPTPAAGELMKAGDVQAMAQGLLNQDATLQATKANRAGDTFTGAVTFNALVTASGGILASGGIEVPTGEPLTTDAGSIASVLGRFVRATRVAVADGAGKVLGVGAHAGIDYVGQRFLLGQPASPRVVKISKLFVPVEGETLEVLYRDGAPGGGVQFTIERDDAIIICTLAVASTPPAAGVALWAELEYVSGVWKMAGNSGCSYYVSDAAYVGVVPGAGA